MSIVFVLKDKSPMFVKQQVFPIKVLVNQVVMIIYQVNNKVVKVQMKKVQVMNNKMFNYHHHQIHQQLVQLKQFQLMKLICYVQQLKMFHMFDLNGLLKIFIHKCKKKKNFFLNNFFVFKGMNVVI